jgi:VCBS repeat-containing protein
VFMRPGAATHAFDMEQRLVGATFTTGSGVLNVTAPPNGKIAPPGYYMLFLLNSTGVPSVGTFVQLTPASADIPPKGTISSPATDVTIVAGQSVSFAGSGSDPDGTISGYSWTFPGGNPSSSALATPGSVTYSAPGTYTATLTVTDNLNVTDPNPPTRKITVNPAPDFSITASPSSRSTVQGGNVPYTISVSALNGFADSVNLSVSGLPSGAQPAFVPTSILGSGSSTLTITTAANTPVGTYTFTITGKTASLTHSTSTTLVVTGSGDFSLSASQANVTLARGASGTDTIVVSALQGFTGQVSLSVAGVPSRVSASLSPSTVPGAGSSKLTIKVNKPAQTGTYNLTVTGTSGNLTHSVPLSLVVQ